jgi:y4mF family transcriptional regulator
MLGEDIKQRRQLLGITQTDLSELSGVGLRTIVNLENGKGNPTLKVLSTIAEALGMEIKLEVKKLNL